MRFGYGPMIYRIGRNMKNFDVRVTEICIAPLNFKITRMKRFKTAFKSDNKNRPVYRRHKRNGSILKISDKLTISRPRCILLGRT